MNNRELFHIQIDKYAGKPVEITVCGPEISMSWNEKDFLDALLAEYNSPTWTNRGHEERMKKAWDSVIMEMKKTSIQVP